MSLTTTWIPEGLAGGQPADFRATEYAYDVEAAQALIESRPRT